MEVTEEELSEKAKESSMWNRLVKLYKMKCKASEVVGLKKDPKTLLRYFELEHGTSEEQGNKEFDD